MSTQLALPAPITPVEIAREKSFGGSIVLCAKAGGYDLDKQLSMLLGVDKAQFSRWQNGQEGVNWPKLKKLMDTCGNHAPLLWMNHDSGYDLYAMRQRETETERQNRILREENAALRRVLMGQGS